MPIFERFRDHLQHSAFFSPNSKIVVAYSGGADSTALLHLLHRAGCDIAAAHLHHGMRDEADQELRLCEAFCAELDVPFLSGRAEVPQIAKVFGIGIEEAGRRARYEFLEKARLGLQCDWIATGHTLDDHAETILFHLVRGSGLSGLAGIPAVRDLIVRPLLPFARAETRAYCTHHHLWFHDDPANFQEEFARVRLREVIGPELSAINPAFRQNLARFAELASEDDRFMNSLAAGALEQAEIELNTPLTFLTRDCEIALDRQRIESLPPVLAKRSLRLVAQALGAQPEADQIAICLEILRSSDLGAVTFQGGQVVAEFESERIHLRDLAPVAEFRYPLTLPGETFADELGWKFTATRGELPEGEPGVGADLDLTHIRPNLYFRNWQEGDRMQPSHKTSEKKIGDLFTDARLTLAARRRLPILCDMVGPVWIPGIATAKRAQATSDTALRLRVRFGPIPAGKP